MNFIKNLLIENSLQQLEKLSIKIAESSIESCVGYGLYEPNFPKELLELKQEEE
ncbi:AgrD family cyclic lactone autoinducer peptide [Clostridium butyricum]|nr:cyclic lactone autoinducer peptide [Clostridium butyricum]